MIFGTLTLSRRIHTSRSLFKSLLTDQYKSTNLWNERLKCPYLSSKEDLISSINEKVSVGDQLNNVELDCFINLAPPNANEIGPLRESLFMVKTLRGGIYANTLLPSTPHALCRLFLYSEKLPSLIHVIEDRVKYGIFPDFFALNLLMDSALDRENLVLGAKLSSFVMLQEEFGENLITDILSTLCMFRYLGLKNNFSDWMEYNELVDPIFKQEINLSDDLSGSKEPSIQKTEDEEEGEEEDAEYIRIPFLRNPYNDNHFDLDKPRLICGKTLVQAGRSLETQNEQLHNEAIVLGHVLMGELSDALKILDSKSDIQLSSQTKDLINHFINELTDVTEPTNETKQVILSKISSVADAPESAIHLLEGLCSKAVIKTQDNDIQTLRQMFDESSRLKDYYQTKRAEKDAKEKLIAEIKAKKDHLEAQEQYLYFYDNLKRTTLTRIEYK